MKAICIGISLACISPIFANPVLAQPRPKEPELRIGKIYIVGNDITQDSVILQAMGLIPGQILHESDVRAAEQSLRRLGIFEDKADTAPSVVLLDGKSDEGQYRDIVVRITETRTGGFTMKTDVTLNGPAIRIGFEERNFDQYRIFPLSLWHIREGRLFRGGGLKVRADLIEINLFGCSLLLPYLTVPPTPPSSPPTPAAPRR